MNSPTDRSRNKCSRQITIPRVVRIAALFTIFFTVIHLRIHAQDSLRVRVYKDYLLTHQLTPAGPIPTALDPNGVYPYTSYVETSNRPILREYQFITLENAHLKVTVCPDLG